MAVALGMVGCTDDYTDWANPHQNPEEAAKTVEMAVNPVADIDLADVTTETVQLFQAEVHSVVPETATPVEGTTVSYTVNISKEGAPEAVQTLTADENCQVSVAELTNAVIALYGKRPEARPLQLEVISYLEDNGEVLKVMGQTTAKVTPVAPVIESAYYLIGDHNKWNPATVRDWKFNHSAADVYDDPVFTLTVPAPVDDAGNRVDFWFNIVPESQVVPLQQNNDGSQLIGSNMGNGDDRTDAGLSVKVDGQANAFCQHAEDGAAYYNITLNMLDGTINIKPTFKEAELWYLVGSCIGDGSWHNGGAADIGTGLIPLGVVPGAEYRGGLGELVYTGYLTTSGFKLIKTPGSWNDQWGQSGDQYVKNDGGSQNITVPADGYYTVKLNTATDVLTIEPYSGTPVVYTQILMAGGFNGWNVGENPTVMAPVTTVEGMPNHDWVYTLETTEGATEAKFLVDSTWQPNWGGEAFPYGVGQNNGSNIPVKPGKYTVVFNDITGAYNFIAVE